MTDKEVELGVIGARLDQDIAFFQDRLQQHVDRISGLEAQLAALEALKAQFPDLAPVIDAAEAPLRGKDDDLKDGKTEDDQIIAALVELKKKFNEANPPVSIRMFAIINGIKEEITKMAVTMKDSQTLPISIEFDDKLGLPVGTPPAASDIAWSLTDPSKGDLAVAADGLSAVFTPKALGDTAVQVADATLNILGSSDTITIVGGDAVSVKLTLGSPQG